MERGLIRRALFGLIVALVACGSAVAKDTPLRALIFSGMNNHDWRSTTPELEAMFKACPRFGTLDVTDNPGQCDAATLARYDVIVSNWTPYPKTAREWPEATEKAFLDFMNKGGGFVVFHASACTFQEWPAFQQIIGLTWEEKKTSHARYGTFKVAVRDATHPIACGLSDFYITDELYQNMVAKTDKPFNVIFDAFSAKAAGGTDKVEPMLIAMPCGNGRSVNLMLGHDAAAMRSVAFRTLMLRSAEWAATGRATIPLPADWPSSYAAACVAGVDIEAALKAASVYRRNEDRASLAVIENLVTAAASRKNGEALAAYLAKALQGDATPDAKAFFCRELGVIGTEKEVPALAALLADETVEVSAQRALEQIPGKAADAALLDALDRVPPKLQIGIINSLGERRTPEAVPALSARIDDAGTGVAAAAALGKIATDECAHVLREALAKASNSQRTPIAEACLACAERLGGYNPVALCKAVEGVEAGGPVRAAAWLTRMRASDASSVDEAARALQSEDRLMREAALRYLRETHHASATDALAKALTDAEPGMLVMLLAALSDRGDASAAKDVLSLATHADPAVRIAALKALARVGNADAASVLLDRAAHAKDAERDAAQMTIDRLNAKGVDAALAESVRAQATETRVEALRALASRKAVDEMGVVLNAASDGESVVREAAWKALKDLAKPPQFPELLKCLPNVHDEERAAAEEALLNVAKRMPESEQQSALLAAWDGADNAPNRSLMRVMGLLGNDWALTKIRDVCAHPATAGLREMAVRVLSAWPTPAPLDDLFAIARSDSEEANRALAMHGIAPMIGRVKVGAPED
ncbi:MAG: ThuA domain-containing protein, partial [Candidatus Hydrogenedentes bacterium]|nr:ThuA domain-containing protein [Candidatus Hydrogenedentota bacterium]